MKLRAHPNVANLAEERRLREQRRAAELADDAVRFSMCFPPGGVMFVGFRAQEPEAATPSPDGCAQRIIHRRLSEATLDDIARRIARRKRQGGRWRLGWLRAVLGLVKRARAS